MEAQHVCTCTHKRLEHRAIEPEPCNQRLCACERFVPSVINRIPALKKRLSINAGGVIGEWIERNGGYLVIENDLWGE